MITKLITDLAFGITATDLIDIAFADWTDVSDRVETVASEIAISRGADNELADTQAGTLTLTLDNTNGDFTPHLATGAYFPNVIKDVPLRQRRAVLESPVTAAPFPLDQLGDTFTGSTLNPVLWSGSYGTVSQTAGRARVGCAAGAYSGVKSAQIWTLQDSSFTIQMPTVPAASTATSCYAQAMVLSTTAGTRAGFEFSPLAGGTLSFRSDVGYFDAHAVTITYSAVDHKWVRIRESGGVLFWDTSPDGVDWTQRRSLAAPGWIDTDFCQVDLQAHRDSGVTDYAEYDYAGGSMQPVRQPVARMSDDFDDGVINTTLWAGNYGTVAEAGGQARVSALAGVHSGFKTARTWTLIESQVIAELVKAPDASTSTTADCNLMVEGATAGTRVGWELDVVNGILAARMDVGYFDGAAITVAYDPNEHRWLRIRHHLGEVFWYTSADGVLWYALRSETAPAWIATDAVAVEMHAYRNAGATSYAAWDLFGATIHPRALVLVNEWPTRWEGLKPTVPIVCTDLFTRLQNSTPLRPMLIQEVVADSPSAYYPLAEDSGTAASGDESGRVGAGVLAVVQKGVGGTLEFGSGIGPNTGLGVPLFTPDTPTDGLYLTGDLGHDFETASAGGGIFVEAWFASTDTTGGTILTLTDYSRSDALHLALAPTTGQITVTKLVPGSATVVFGGLGPNLFDGLVHHVLVDTGGEDVYIDGVLIGTDPGLGGNIARRYLYVGAYVGGTYQWTGSVSHVAVYDSFHTAAQLLDHYTAGTTGFSGETAFNRVTRLLGYVSLDTENTNAVDVVGPQFELGRSALDHLREVEAAEGGRLYASRRGAAITLRSRFDGYNASPAFTLKYVDAESGMEVAFDDQKMVNTVLASRPGGATQRILDADSVFDLGPKEQPLDLIKTTDDQVAIAAAYLLARHAYPLPELRSVTVVASTLRAPLYRRILDADIGTVFSLVQMPAEAPHQTEIATIAGYTETSSAGEHKLTFHTNATDTDQYWVLDDPVLSVLGTTTRLAY